MAEEKKESKYKGYKPQKGVTPPWDPFNPAKRKKRITIKERKFLFLLSKTGNQSQAYRSVYKVKTNPDKRIEAARVSAMANQTIRRLRDKFPELVEELLYEDIDPKWIRKELVKNYKSDTASMGDRIRLLELMGKIHAMWTDKKIVDSKIQDITQTIYSESDSDFPEEDKRMDRLEIEKTIGNA